MRLPNKKVLVGLANDSFYYTSRFYYFLAPVIGYPDEVAIYRSPLSSLGYEVSSDSDYVIVKVSFLERLQTSPTPHNRRRSGILYIN